MNIRDVRNIYTNLDSEVVLGTEIVYWNGREQVPLTIKLVDMGNADHPRGTLVLVDARERTYSDEGGNEPRYLVEWDVDYYIWDQKEGMRKTNHEGWPLRYNIRRLAEEACNRLNKPLAQALDEHLNEHGWLA